MSPNLVTLFFTDNENYDCTDRTTTGGMSFMPSHVKGKRVKGEK
jgi:hypothetical protein